MASSHIFLVPSNVLLAFVLCLVLYVYRRTNTRRDVLSLPCPPNASWLWGHDLEAFERPCGDFYTKYIEAYGPTYRIKGAFGHKDILVLTDPTGIAHVFRNVYNYPHSEVFRPLIDRLLGRGLVWVEGESEHKKMRKLINPVFSVESVKTMGPAIYESAGSMQARMCNDLFDKNGGITVNILDYTSGATLNIIGKVGFDHDFGQGSSVEAKRIANSWRAQVNLGLERSGFIAMMILRLFPFITSLPLAAIQAQGEIKTIIKQIALKMVQRQGKEAGDRNNLLSILMRDSLNDKEPISEDQLLDHICTFVFVLYHTKEVDRTVLNGTFRLAGHETVSSSLGYTLWELARNPETQQCLRNEVLAFPGNPTYDDFQTKLPYLDACCKEGLRVYPPSAHMERVVENQDVIPLHFPVKKSDGKLHTSICVEKGQLIYLPSISLNRLNLIWDDGATFRPERWLEPNKGTTSSVKISGWSNIFSFSDGPRQCVGFRMAVFEWKVLMLTLIRHFIFHDTGAEVVSRFSSTLQPRVVGRESEGVQLPIKVTLV